MGIKNGVDLAVRQANQRHAVKGWRIALSPEDDRAVPELGAGAATRLADNPAVMAVVGPLNSSVAEKVAPILASRKIVTVSPATTDPTLTRGPDPAHPARPSEWYFRVATTDLAQGPFAADYAYQTAGKRTAAVVHDGTDYGRGLALGFKARFEKLGGRVPAVETVGPQDRDFSAVLARLKRAGPDLIYFGGEFPAGSRLTAQADQQGITAPLMGGYGILDPAYVAGAREAAVGDLATSVGAPTEQLPGARSFEAAYRAAGYADPPSAYGAYAYDAANVIIAALATGLPGQARLTAALRTRLRQAVQDGTAAGVTGPLAFDGYGDTTSRFLTVYEVEKDAAGALAWKPEETRAVE